jgi:hypothetical protein
MTRAQIDAVEKEYISSNWEGESDGGIDTRSP